MCKWCKWVLVWGLSLDSLLVVSLLICRWLFHCWWIFLRWWMFLWGEGTRKGGEVDWLVWWDEGMVGYWPKVFLRACMRALVLGVLFLCCHKCHSGWNWKYFIIPKTTYRFIESDVSFYWKHSIVLSKTSCHFIENIVSFYRKQRVVLWKTTCCFGLEVEKLFWGWYFGDFWGWSSSVKVWQCGKLFLKSM